MKKTVLITRTSSSFGKATVRRFAKYGWKAIVTIRQPDVEKELTGLSDILVNRLDVESSQSITKSIQAGIFFNQFWPIQYDLCWHSRVEKSKSLPHSRLDLEAEVGIEQE